VYSLVMIWCAALLICDRFLVVAGLHVSYVSDPAVSVLVVVLLALVSRHWNKMASVYICPLTSTGLFWLYLASLYRIMHKTPGHRPLLSQNGVCTVACSFAKHWLIFRILLWDSLTNIPHLNVSPHCQARWLSCLSTSTVRALNGSQLLMSITHWTVFII